MSLLEGAHELARNENKMGCAVEHVFLTAITPEAYIFRDVETTRALEIFNGQTLREWALQARTKLENFKDPPPVGKDSDLLTKIIEEARADAAARRREFDDVTLLLFVVLRTGHIQTWIDRITPGDSQRLIERLREPFAASGVKEPSPQQADQDEMRRARTSLEDLRRVYQLAQDIGYSDHPAVDVTTFLDYLADAADQANVLVAVGRDGTLIDEIPKVVASCLTPPNSFGGQRTSLHAYNGKLYRVNLRQVLDRSKREAGLRPVTILRAVWEDLLKNPDEKHILLLDHFEAIKSDDKGQDIEDLRAFIANPGRLLVFGVYHAPNHGDHTAEANLGREDTVKTLPMTVYDKALTQTLLTQFYLPRWQKEGPRGFVFTGDAFDALIALAPGAWVRRHKMVLPCLVTDVVGDAMDRARKGDEQVTLNAQGALQAFEELRTKEAPGHKDRARFEPTLQRAEQDVKMLIPAPASRNLLGKMVSLVYEEQKYPRQNPNKPIKIYSAHVMAEFICHNVSEFHYDGFQPLGITRED